MEKATLAAYPIPKPRHSHCWGFRLLKRRFATAAGRKDRNSRDVLAKGIKHLVWTHANIRKWLSLGKKRREALETAAITGALPIARRQLDDDAAALTASR